MSKSADRAWQRASRLSGRQWNALLNAVRLLAWARIEHRRKPIKTVLERFEATGSHADATAGEVEIVAWAINSAAARVPWRSDCLLQAMAGSRWLDAMDRNYRLNIGVRKNPANELEAHAWLTSGGHVVTGHLPDLEAFSPIPLESGISRF